MKVAAAYIRVSTDDQIEFSPDSQLEKIKLYAERNQMLLPKEFIFMDEGISGRNTKKRAAFNTMIGLAKRKPKPFDVILVWKYSRFARNREDSVVYKSMLRKELNIDVISISEDVGDDKMSILFEAMIEAMDEYYSINLAEEVKRGMTEKAKRGGVLSIAGYGYKVVNGEYVIVPEEAEIIKKKDYLTEYSNAKNVELESMQRSLQNSDEFYKKLYNTLSKIAESGGYSMILSLQDSNSILWYSSSVDITNQVISELGL